MRRLQMTSIRNMAVVAQTWRRRLQIYKMRKAFKHWLEFESASDDEEEDGDDEEFKKVLGDTQPYSTKSSTTKQPAPDGNFFSYSTMHAAFSHDLIIHFI